MIKVDKQSLSYIFDESHSNNIQKLLNVGKIDPQDAPGVSPQAGLQNKKVIRTIRNGLVI